MTRGTIDLLSSSKSQSFKVTLDGLSMILIIIGVAVFLFLQINPAFSGPATSISLIIVFGLVLMLILNDFKLDITHFIAVGFYDWTLWVLADIAVIGVITFLVQQTGGLATIPDLNSDLTILIAIAEEVFFRGFFTVWIARTSRSEHWGIIGGGLVFGSYHYLVFGNNIFGFVIYAAAGMVLSASVLETGELSTSMVPHLTINAIALGVL